MRNESQEGWCHQNHGLLKFHDSLCLSHRPCKIHIERMDSLGTYVVRVTMYFEQFQWSCEFEVTVV